MSSSIILARERVRWAVAKYITIFMLYLMINPRSINGMAMKFTNAHAMYSISIAFWPCPTPCNANNANIDIGINNAVMMMPSTRITFGSV